MNKSSLHSEYCKNVEEELGKIAIEEVAEDMEEILSHFNKLNGQLLDKYYKEKADKIFKCIPMKMEIFYEKFDKECMKIPIFKYYDPYQLFQRISCSSNEDIVRIKEKLIIRANKHPKEIEAEMKNISQLKQIIDDYLKGKEQTIKIVMLSDLAKELGYILDKYKVTEVTENEEK
jgi:plasmid stability protein